MQRLLLKTPQETPQHFVEEDAPIPIGFYGIQIEEYGGTRIFIAFDGGVPKDFCIDAEFNDKHCINRYTSTDLHCMNDLFKLPTCTAVYKFDTPAEALDWTLGRI